MLIIRNFGDVDGELDSLKVGSVIVVEARLRGNERNQSLTTFSKQENGGRVSIIVVISWDACESIQGIVVEAQITNILKKSARETILFTQFRAEYEGDEFPVLQINDLQFCRDHVDDICSPGTRIVLKIDGLGWYTNQCISSWVDPLDFVGIKFIISNTMGADDTWIGARVQATVLSSYSTEIGHYVVKCTFVKLIQEPVGQRQQQVDRDQIATERSARFLEQFKGSERIVLKTLRAEAEQRQVAGEAAEYCLEVDDLYQLKDQGVEDPEDLRLYSRHKHFIEKDYTLQALRTQYPEVYAMWEFVTRIETTESTHFQDVASRLEGKNVPDWVAAYYVTKGRSFCAYHNGRGRGGYGHNCAAHGCTFTHKCLLCDSPGHGAFHMRDEGAEWVWRCKVYRKYRQQLDLLQGDGGWTQPSGQPVQEAHIRELFNINSLPYALLEPLNEVRFTTLRDKFEQAQKGLALVEKLTQRQAQGLVINSADLKKVTNTAARAKAALAEVEANDYYYLLQWRLPALTQEPSSFIINTAVHTVPSDVPAVAPAPAAGAVVPPPALHAGHMTLSQLMQALRPVPVAEVLQSMRAAEQKPSPVAVNTLVFDSPAPDRDAVVNAADLAALSTLQLLEEEDHSKMAPAQAEAATSAVVRAREEVEVEEEEEELLPPRKKRPVHSYKIGSFEQLVLSLDCDERYDMGRDVYRAHLLNTLTGKKRAVAVKVYDSNHNDKNKLLKTIRRELQAMENLTSQHTVKYIASAEIQYPPTEGSAEYMVIIMEQEQCLLEEYLSDNCYGLPDVEYLQKIKPLIRQLLTAYIDIHAAQIIHRDVKPENTLVSVSHTGEAMVKVCDFGLCTTKDIFEKGNAHKSALRANTWCGTVYRGCWVAPEVLECRNNNSNSLTHKSYSFEADIWPLGLLFYFIGTRGLSPMTREFDALTAMHQEVARLGFLRRTRRELMIAHNIDVSTLSQEKGSWTLSAAFPLLFDLIELMVRPFDGTGSAQDRVPLQTAAAHPFFWDNTIAARVITEFVDEINSRTVALHEFIRDLNTTCANTVLKDGWDRNHQMFQNTTGSYNTRDASWLLKALRDTLVHGRDNIQRSTTYVCNQHYKSCLMDAFVRAYGPVLCVLYRVSLTTMRMPDGTYVRKYGKWSDSLQQNFKFDFYATPVK